MAENRETSPDAGTRLDLRLTTEQNSLISKAAHATGRSSSSFVLTAALVRAEDVLASRRIFSLPDSAWDAFNELLDRPAQHKPELAKLLTTAAPWDE